MSKPSYQEKPEIESEEQQVLDKQIAELAAVQTKPNGFATAVETQNTGGSMFDPARWKTTSDSRLDPSRKITPTVFAKVEVRKPPQDHYVHAHPDPVFNAVFPLYADSESKRYDPYLIAPDLSLPPQAAVNVKQTRLAVAISDTGRLFLWHIPQTGSEWHESGDNAIVTAMTQWVKVLADTSAYRLEYPEVTLPPPAFPDWILADYLSRAFKDRYIAGVDHPIIKRLAGLR